MPGIRGRAAECTRQLLGASLRLETCILSPQKAGTFTASPWSGVASKLGMSNSGGCSCLIRANQVGRFLSQQFERQLLVPWDRTVVEFFRGRFSGLG